MHPLEPSLTLKLVQAGRDLEASARRREDRVDAKQIRELIQQLTAIAPVLLLIDELARTWRPSPTLQVRRTSSSCRSWPSGRGMQGIRVLSSFHPPAHGFRGLRGYVSAVQRREWIKVQGRFEDIPFIDTPAQTRALVAASFQDSSRGLAAPLGHGRRSRLLRFGPWVSTTLHQMPGC